MKVLCTDGYVTVTGCHIVKESPELVVLRFDLEVPDDDQVPIVLSATAPLGGVNVRLNAMPYRRKKQLPLSEEEAPFTAVYVDLDGQWEVIAGIGIDLRLHVCLHRVQLMGPKPRRVKVTPTTRPES